MSTKKEYENKHWKWITKAEFNHGKMSRKTKKALTRHFDEITKEYETSDEYILRSLPDCEICDGNRFDDPYDIGWGFSERCKNCDGTGKIGWKYGEGGAKVPIKEFIKIHMTNTLINKGFLNPKSS